MDPVSREEISCLHSVAASRVKGESDCAPGVLLHLQQRGFVVQRPQRSLPLGCNAYDYTLTPAGKSVLERLNTNNK